MGRVRINSHRLAKLGSQTEGVGEPDKSWQVITFDAYLCSRVWSIDHQVLNGVEHDTDVAGSRHSTAIAAADEEYQVAGLYFGRANLVPPGGRPLLLRSPWEVYTEMVIYSQNKP